MPARHPARLAGAIKREPGRTEFLRAIASWEDRVLLATPLANQASGAVTSMAQANALLVVAADKGSLAAGDAVDILWLHELGA